MDKLHPRSRRLPIPMVLLAIVTLYLLSFGPACWIVLRTGLHGGPWVGAMYRPIMWVWEYSPHAIRSWITIYANFGTHSNYWMDSHNGELVWYDRGYSAYHLVTGR